MKQPQHTSTHQHQTLAHFKHRNTWVDQLRRLVNLKGYQPETAERILRFKDKKARRIEIK